MDEQKPRKVIRMGPLTADNYPPPGGGRVIHIRIFDRRTGKVWLDEDVDHILPAPAPSGNPED